MSEAHHPTDRAVDDLPPLEHDPELDGPDPGAPGALVDRGDELAHGGRCTAAGVIVLRAGETGPRIAVLESGGVVSLPKAEAGPGESAETAAHRAAEAFVGRKVRLVESVGEALDVLDGEEVSTWFWLARPHRSAPMEPAIPPPAGFHLHWLDPEEAEQALDSDAERALLERLRLKPLPPARRSFGSLRTMELARELEAFRDESAAAARHLQDPERLDALLRAREEIERAEGRLARGDAAGARRARARAEREVLGSLDGPGRALALQRALDRAPAHLRATLRAAAPGPGEEVSADVLLAIQAAVDAAHEEQERAAEVAGAAQVRATAALGVTTALVLGAAALGLFGPAPGRELGTGLAAVLFATCGLLGGWVGEALHALREPDRARHLSLPLTATCGALAGLALGAFLSGGLGSFVIEDAALVVAATFTAGWVARFLLPRGAAA